MEMEVLFMPRQNKAGLEVHWLRVLDDFSDSNCSVSQYCQQLNISKASLYKWSHRLGVPLKGCKPIKERPVNQKEPQPITQEDSSLFSFIELNASCPPMNPSLPVKFELLLAQGRSLKIEAPSSWDGVIGLAKALVS